LRLALGAVVLLTTAAAAVAFAQPGDPSPAESLQIAWSEGDCDQCHTVPGHEELPRTESCTTCHLWVRKVAANPRARERAIQVFPKWERYERNVASYLSVPDLEVAMARLQPSWVRAWLQDPHDVRPGLYEGMPRFDLSEDSLDAFERAFAEGSVEVPARPAPDPANVEAGAALFETRGCLGCHAFGATKPVPGLPTAPDLAHARARLSGDMAVAWILNPQAISGKATMPPLGLTEADALALRDYLFLADPGGAEPPKAGDAPVATTEPVTWAQVEERVFGKICVHCHMDPAQNEGRAGPGNAGGFGWPATGIELQTPQGVAAVAEQIPDALMRRRDEARRDYVLHGFSPATVDRPDLPGMPLGLPAIPDDDIALVLGWIEQGMPVQ